MNQMARYSHFTLHDPETAPGESAEQLRNAEQQLGMIPNLYRVLAESPQTLEAYDTLNGLFTNTSFDATEQTVVWQSISVEHGCHYCVPAHTAIAHAANVPEEVTEALRNRTPLPDERLEALRTFTLSLVRRRGFVDEASLELFLRAGFTTRHVLEIVLGIAQKTISNYTNHLAQTPVDPEFERFAWSET